MKNLIRNSRWYTDQSGKTSHFENNGPAVDIFSVQGFRTRSLTLTAGDTKAVVIDRYEPMIPVKGKRAIRWGYRIRAIESQSVILGAEFYDASGNLLHTLKHPVGNYITAQFQPILIRFPVPPKAETVQLFLELSGKITACTYYAPTAFFCK